ncbi:MAG: O-antigen ligase family protein [Marinifilaceae bacterium]
MLSLKVHIENKTIHTYGALLLLSVAYAFLIAGNGLMWALGGIILPFLLLFLTRTFQNPEIGLWTAFIFNYFVLGLTRYIPAPFGLSIDLLLILSILAVFFKHFKQKSIWRKAKTDLTLLAAIWFMYGLFQLINPETVSRVAWFYAMRGISLYMLLSVVLGQILFDEKRHLSAFLWLWFFFALLGVAKGLQQKFLFLDPFEQRWLNAGAAVTHVLFGKLRVFSFFSDAGQYGAAMGLAGVVFGIIALHTTSLKYRIIYTTGAALFLYALMISGTRGAIAVPFGGAILYVILGKNIKLIATGFLLGVAVFVFFKYTTIGQNNYEIRRLRTAFDPEDASLQVRLANQRILKSYLASRPFGGGIGSAGNWGKRFTPHTFLANVATDSWYVMIWAEQGIVGLLLHLSILFYVLIKASYIIMYKLKNKWLKIRMQALASGMFGILLASYGNGVLGQMPTGLIMYLSMAFLFMAPKLDRKLSSTTENKIMIPD